MLASETTPGPSANLSSVVSRMVLSGQGGAVATVKVIVKWPQDYVLVGRIQTCATYDQLTQGQWVQVYVSMILDSSGNQVVYMNILNL